MKSEVYKKVLLASLATTMAVAPLGNVAAMSQDETVYVNLGSAGEAQSISVTEHLINDLKENELWDETVLEDIENLNGYETFAVDGSKVTWQANNKDIYYRGKTTKELPVEMEIRYTLNGEEKPVEEIIGKSGQVEIELKYINHSKVQDLYTPFVVAVATTLDESKVEDLQVTNGKIVSNGRKIAVTAVAAPGLYESLGIEELKDVDKVKISFETEKLELNEIYSIVTPKLLDADSLKTFTQLDELYGSMNTLSNSSKQLVKGASELKRGTQELKSGIASAKQKLQSMNISIDNVTMANIKAAASNAATNEVEAQRAAVAARVKEQIENNVVLMNALELQAAKMCSEAAGGMDCPMENITEVRDQLVQKMEATMTESSLTMLKQTATQTAAATAEKVASQVADTVQKKVTALVGTALDSMLQGAAKLADGATKLDSGMTKFDRDGIQTLTNFVNGKVKVTTDRVERLLVLADQYDNYAGIADHARGTTKFIMMTGARKVE